LVFLCFVEKYVVFGDFLVFRIAFCVGLCQEAVFYRG